MKSLNSPTPLPAGYGVLKQEQGGGSPQAIPDDRYSDYETSSTDRPLILQWQDDKNGRWSKEHEVSLGTLGNTNMTRMLAPMGVYRSRQYRFILNFKVKFVLCGIEEDSYVQGS